MSKWEAFAFIGAIFACMMGGVARVYYDHQTAVATVERACVCDEQRD